MRRFADEAMTWREELETLAGEKGEKAGEGKSREQKGLWERDRKTRAWTVLVKRCVADL